jgi:hypothetical protein
MSTAERIIWGAWGLLSLILLIVWLRWMGTPEDQKKDEPPGNANQERVDQSIGSARASISLARLLRSMQRSRRVAKSRSFIEAMATADSFGFS